MSYETTGLADVGPGAATAAQPSSWTELLQSSLPGLIQAYQTRQIIKAQTQRAAQGLAPLDMTAYTAPIRTESRVMLEPTGAASTTLLMIGGGAVGLLLLAWLATRKRR